MVPNYNTELNWIDLYIIWQKKRVISFIFKYNYV